MLPLGMAIAVGGVVVAVAVSNTSPSVKDSSVYRGHVAQVSGSAPVAANDACEVRIAPASGKFNCRIVVQCGGKVIYGHLSSNGYATCQVDGGAAVSATETAPDDSDPDIILDIVARSVMVREPKLWQVDVVLDPG